MRTRLVRHLGFCLALGVVGVAMGPAPARAQDGIFNIVTNLSSLSSDSPNDDEASTDFEISRLLTAQNDAFTSRYGFSVSADSKSTNRAKLAGAVHEVSFEVHSSRGYTLTISTGWVGQMARRADALQCADAVVLSGVTGEVIAGFGLSSGSLSLSDPPDITLQTVGDETVEISEVADARIVVARASPVEFHTLRFRWDGGVVSDTCEAAIRLGGPNGTTTECATCSYPGDPVRDQQFDGHFVNVQYIPSDCGNGQVDSGEECDLGAGNGFGACCDIFCKREPDQMPCSDGLFCNGDGRCAAGLCVELGDPCAGEVCAVCDEENDLCVACTPVSGPTPTPTPAACAGDCDGDGSVAINELVQAVSIALGNGTLASCAAADVNRDASLAINELVEAVGAALGGCR